MRREEANYLYVGLFVIAMVVLLSVVLFRVTGRAMDTESYFAHFKNITGVAQGSPVTFGGYQIGQIDDITPRRSEGATEFSLELRVREGWKIPADSVARITAPGLLAEYQVDILEGDSPELLSPGETMGTREGAGVFANLESLLSEINDLSQSGLRPLLASLKAQVDALGGELGTQIPRLSGDISRLIERVDANMSRLGAFLDEGNRRHVANIISNADAVSSDLKQLAATFNDSGRELNELLRRSGDVVAENEDDIRSAVSGLNRSVAVVSRDIDAIVYNLEATSRNLNEFTRQLRRNPAALLNSRPPRDQEMEGAAQ